MKQNEFKIKKLYDSVVNLRNARNALDEIVLGGGGAYNKTLIKYLRFLLPDISIKTHADYGINDKYKEALAFAMLGYCTVNRIANNLPSCTGAKSKVVMGEIAYS